MLNKFLDVDYVKYDNVLLHHASVLLFTTLFDQRRYSTNTGVYLSHSPFCTAAEELITQRSNLSRAKQEETQLPALPPIKIQGLATAVSQQPFPLPEHL